MKVIILNGPPGCGKDTLADFLINALPMTTEKHEFKHTLYVIAAVLAGIPLEQMKAMNNRETKEQPSTELPDGRSPRQWLIHVSERIVKPNLGPRYFGKAALKRLTNEACCYVFADGGFDEEVLEISRGIGRDNVLVIQLTRPGHSFEGDSRRYITEGISGQTVLIDNDSDLETLKQRVLEEVQTWLAS